MIISYPRITDLSRVSTMLIVLRLLLLACCEVNSSTLDIAQQRIMCNTLFSGPNTHTTIVEDVDDDDSPLPVSGARSGGAGGGGGRSSGGGGISDCGAAAASKRGRANYLQTVRAYKAETQAEASKIALAEAQQRWPGNVRKLSAWTVHQYHKEAIDGCGDFKESYQGSHAKVEWLLQDKERRKRFMDFVDLHGIKKGEKNMSAKTELYDFVNFTLFRVIKRRLQSLLLICLI